MVLSSLVKDLRAAFGDVEAVPYTVVVQRGGYEERVYPARRWVCTTMAGPSRHNLVSPMFRRLFCYISGRNEPNVRIDMTTPVVTLVEPRRKHGGGGGKNGAKITSHTASNGTFSSSSSSSSSLSVTSPSSPTSSTSSTSSSSSSVYTMGFLLPSSHQETPPPSSDKNIFVEERPKLVVLCRRFSGYMDDEVVQRELSELHQAIVNNGDDDGVDFTKYYVAGYDPPFKLLGRRNEVWLLKVVKEGGGDGGGEGEVVMTGSGGGAGGGEVSNGGVNGGGGGGVVETGKVSGVDNGDAGVSGGGGGKVNNGGNNSGGGGGGELVFDDDDMVELVAEDGNEEVMLS